MEVVWRTSASQGPFPLSDENTLALPVPLDSDGESDSSDRIPVPSFQNSFSQAIEAALLKLDKPSTADHLSGKRQGARCEKFSASSSGRSQSSSLEDQKLAAEQF